jgi:hypothetical protein
MDDLARDPQPGLRAAAGPEGPASTFPAVELFLYPANDGSLAHDADTPVGAVWRAPDQDAEGREAWAVMLPNDAGVWWTTARATGTTQMWDVSGEAPRFTVTPAILIPGLWHGHITDGRFV